MKGRFIKFLNKYKKLNKAITTLCMCCVFIVGGCALPSYAAEVEDLTADSYVLSNIDTCQIWTRVDDIYSFYDYAVGQDSDGWFYIQNVSLDNIYSISVDMSQSGGWVIPYSVGYDYYITAIYQVVGSSASTYVLPDSFVVGSGGGSSQDFSDISCYNWTDDTYDYAGFLCTEKVDLSQYSNIDVIQVCWSNADLSLNNTIKCKFVINRVPKSASGISIDYTSYLSNIYTELIKSNVYLNNYLVPLNETLTGIATTFDNLVVELLEQGATLDSIDSSLNNIFNELFDVGVLLENELGSISADLSFFYLESHDFYVDNLYWLEDISGGIALCEAAIWDVVEHISNLHTVISNIDSNVSNIASDTTTIKDATNNIYGYLRQVITGLLTGIRNALTTGSEESQSTVTEFENSSDNLSSTITDYNATQENFYSDFQSNQSVILEDVQGWDWGGLVDCANWIGFTLTDYYNNMGDFKQYIIYPLMLGIALFFLGRGDSIIGHLYRKPTVTFTHTETRSTKSGGVTHTNTVSQREGGVFRK